MHLLLCGIKCKYLLVEGLDHAVATAAEPSLLLEAPAHLLHVDLALLDIRLLEHKRVDSIAAEHHNLGHVVLAVAQASYWHLLEESRVFDFERFPILAHHHIAVINALLGSTLLVVLCW